MASEQTIPESERPVILLVEDEALTIMDLGDVLEDGGYDTVQCASAERALSILQARPDICGLVTDVELSGKANGFELANSVAEARPHLPIVIVSGMITGCAGGVLRDILCNEVPLLFRSELYASVSVVTGLFYATAFGLNLNPPVWTLLTFVLGLSFRMLAIRYKWEMPKFVFSGEER